MRVQAAGREMKVSGVTDFHLEHIFECGQCFRWNRDAFGGYTGVAHGAVTRVRKEGDAVFFRCTAGEFEKIWRRYFHLDLDYAAVRARLRIDPHMARATAFGAGLRILRQAHWEALCSFIISQCNNIPRIKQIVETLCRMCGDEILFEGETFYTFPDAGRVAALREADLAPLRAGYRGKYILSAAEKVASGALRLDELAAGRGEDALAALKTLPGVGDKVASCAVLFGLHMLDAFPVDTWMRKAIARHYKNGLDPAVFSPYAGIAQQYLFYYERSGPPPEKAV